MLDTTDVYGGVTHSVYDAAGNLVQTIYPDGTEQRTVYDGQGRVIWQSDRYASATVYTPPAQGADPNSGTVSEDSTTTANATYTIYDKSGNVIATERHSGALISIAADPAAGGVSGILTSSLGSAGSVVSSTSTMYDALGRVVETIDASGTRTGTIYYDNGQVRYTGELLPETDAQHNVGVSDKGTSPWWTAAMIGRFKHGGGFQ